MASRDLTPSLGSPWDAILQAVRDQLPSLDSDSSSLDSGEEELFVFQRNETVLIPDLSEELAEDLADDVKFGAWVPAAEGSPSQDGTEAAVLVPVEQTTQPRTDCRVRTEDSASGRGRAPESCGETSCLPGTARETLTRLDGDLRSKSFDTTGSQSRPWHMHGGAILLLQDGDQDTEPQGAAPPDFAGRRALRRARRKMIEKDILHKVTWDAQDPTCGTQSQPQGAPCAAAESGPQPEDPMGPLEGPPVLSLQQLEDWDLDSILQSLSGLDDSQGSRTPGTVWWTADLSQCQEHTVLRGQDRLMEQLALLSAAQSRATTSARRTPAVTPQDAGSRCALTKSGFQAEPDKKGAEGRWLKAEPPTIFIDLRQAGPPGHHFSPESSSSSHSSSDSEEEEEEETRGNQQGPAALRACTGKSQLLQQLRAFRKGTAQSQLPAKDSCGGQKVQAPEDLAQSGAEKKHEKLWPEGQGAQTKPLGGQSQAPGPGTAREPLVPPLGQP
ncbi:dynein axonemal-associated protein 1 isoform X2 [Ochotona curzoniae]|uniref:dynein axonemal-associated protein 1 isoform X2 n=1 Tax=Ochotona curzoniae TaxID=130825 RepID=UPI001B34FF10|nr:dynein axonemal-associated protein 1 isoform X2 [Ochotona curzoniae]